MEIKLDNNIVNAKELAVCLNNFTDCTEFVLKELKFNYYYEDNVRTDKFSHTSLTLVDAENFAVLKVKVNGRVALTAEEFAKEESVIFVELDPEKTWVIPYDISYGKCRCSIVTDSVKINRN